MFLGENYREQDLSEGLRLAKDCGHGDARWLVGSFPDGILSRKKAKNVFLAQGGDGRALCFAGLVKGFDRLLVLQSANLGYGLAQGKVAELSAGSERLVWAEKSAAQKDRTGLSVLSDCFFEDLVVRRDVQMRW